MVQPAIRIFTASAAPHTEIAHSGLLVNPIIDPQNPMIKPAQPQIPVIFGEIAIQGGCWTEIDITHVGKRAVAVRPGTHDQADRAFFAA